MTESAPGQEDSNQGEGFSLKRPRKRWVLADQMGKVSLHWKPTILIPSHFKGKETEVWREPWLLSLSAGDTSSRETSVMLTAAFS